MARKTKKKNESPISLINRTPIMELLLQQFQQKKSTIVLKGDAGVGKSVILSSAQNELKKKSYTGISFRGIVYPEMVLKAIIEKAIQMGHKDLETVYESRTPFKEKLEKLMDSFLLKQNILLTFDDFHMNQDSEDGKIKNERLNELISFLEGALQEKPAAMIITTRYDLLKLDFIEVESFTWEETVEWINKRKHLQQFNDKSLKYFYFEMGGFPYAVELCETIARREFAEEPFQWTDLRDRVPRLTERILHKESETVDFSYLLADHIISSTTDIAKDLKGVYGAGFILGNASDEEAKKFHLEAANALAGNKYNGDHIQCLRHYIKADEVDRALKIATDMDNYFCSIGFPQLAFDMLQLLESCVEKMRKENQLNLHGRLGMFYGLFGKLDDAQQQHERALVLCEEMEKNLEIAFHLGQLGTIHEARGKYEEALEPFKRSLEICKTLGDDRILAQRLQQTGSIQKRLGNYEEALQLYLKALEVSRNLQDSKAIAKDQEQLARIHDEQGRFDEALVYYFQAIDTMQASSDKTGVAAVQHQVGNVQFVKRDLDIAFETYKKNLQLNQELKDHKAAGFSRGQMGLILQRKGMIDEALEQYQLSLADFKQSDEKRGMAAGYHQLGRIYQTQKEMDKALKHYQKAVEIREENGDILGAAITYGQLGLLYYEKEQLETSLRYSVQAYAVFSKYGSPNVQLARQNMLRIQAVMPKETFDNILKEYNIQT